MGTCFVIQPFDRGKFDKRYADTYKPAIIEAGLDAYRVDNDPSSEIPIEDIEKNIRRAEVCFAEITTDNPNVWFELGYAIAARKPIVMVCSEERDRFPFDVQHRTVIRYRPEAPSDFRKLGEDITARLKAAMERQREIETIEDLSPTVSEGLTQHEVAAMVAIASWVGSRGGALPPVGLTQEMDSAGYTELASVLAARGLLKRDFINLTSDWDGNNEYHGYVVTDTGLDWLEENRAQLKLRHPEPKRGDFDDDLPF